MLAKVSIFILGIFLIGVVLLSGCVSNATNNNNLGTTQSNLTNNNGTANSPNNGGPSEVDPKVINVNSDPNAVQPEPTNPKGSEQATKDALNNLGNAQAQGTETSQQQQAVTDAATAQTNAVINDPNATPMQLLNALGLAQSLGLPNEGAIDTTAKAKILNWALDIINNPNSSNSMLLNALEVIEKMGLDTTGKINQQVWDTIKKRVSNEINDQYTCVNRLKEIAILCGLLGWTDLQNQAEAKEKTAETMCSRMHYEYESTEPNSYLSEKYDIIGTTLKQYEAYGMTVGLQNYYLEEGKFLWSYKSVVDSGCTITTQEGTGEIPITLENKKLFLGFDVNTHYYGSPFFNVDVNYDKIPSSTRDSYCDTLPDQQLGKGTMMVSMQISINGFATGNKLIGQNSRIFGPQTEDQATGQELTYWNLTING